MHACVRATSGDLNLRKRIMKKMFVAVLAVAAVLSLSGCESIGKGKGKGKEPVAVSG